MHCELVLPALFAESAEARLPSLEMILARARSSHGAPQTLPAWLGEMFDVDEPLPAGALTALADGMPGVEGPWTRADPVHLRLARDHLILLPSAGFPLSSEEARALCEALNRHFEGTLVVHAFRPDRWSAQLARALAIDAPCPLDMAGRDVEASLPRSLAPGELHAVLNEAQMLLHAHPVNEAREARGEPAVNSLWFWGSGALPAHAKSPWNAVMADEPVALGLARLAGGRALPLPPDAQSWLERAPEDGRYLMVLDALRAPFALSQTAEYRERLQELEQRWFAPLLAALRAGRIGMVTVHAPEAGASFETIRGDLRRFWRRPKSIGHYA